jgi:DNA-binding transcriptional MerR regulator
MITIKDFSINSGFSIRMLRYLEEVGLLIPKRDNSNYRIYSEVQIAEAKKIKALQNLGIQLKEIETIQSSDKAAPLEVLEKALAREQEIAEIKSDSIPELKNVIDFLRKNDANINAYFEKEKKLPRKMRTLGGDEKFHRTAYNIPILKNIYEDHLTIESNINLIATDLMKFSEWFEGCDYIPDVFNVLRESSFVFGKNISNNFIKGYEKSWNKFLPEMGFQRMEDFVKEDVGQLMGPHDIIIRSTFSYVDSGEDGEIIIPYTPIYTMAQLSNKT